MVYFFFHAYGKSSLFSQLACKVILGEFSCTMHYNIWKMGFFLSRVYTYLLKIQCTWCHASSYFFYSLQSNSPTHSDTEEFLDVLHDIAGVCRRIATVIEKMKK